MINFTINDQLVEVEPETTILEAAKQVGIHIPTLCYHPDLAVKANCRVCVVEVAGMDKLQAACMTQVREGLVVETRSQRVREARRIVVELMLANHDQTCTTCDSNGTCELRQLADRLNIKENRYDQLLELSPIVGGNPSILRDMNKCIKCGRCIQVCNDIQQVGAIYNIGRSTDMYMGPAYKNDLTQSHCTFCGQCINVCPVGAIYEKNDIKEVLDAIEDDSKHVIVQIAPAVRVSIGEMFGLSPGSIVTGKIPAILRKIGFDKVFDTDFTADLTILEEGTELLGRLKNNGVLPMLTSCSPGWINYIEQFYPELIPHLSTCKSPQQMFGALAKTYYADKMGISPDDLVVVSIMPCTAKKYEAQREEMGVGDTLDVDYVLTTREFGKMIKIVGYDINDAPEEAFDEPFGITTGAGVIFGASGGVMEAALRTVYEVVTGEELEDINLTAVRGMEGIKEASIPVGDLMVNVAVTNSLSRARDMMELIKDGKADYHFVEVMCCPGGCIGGGGQPRPTTNAIRKERIAGIYEADADMILRKSHKNPAVLKLYEEFLGEPNSHKAHELLHTTYTERGMH
ncbi:MAG: NADH-dependent [FeFe] hydrogenase, group A6 [Vallitaleaceae bacterium]|jgi:iron-only hydrogenase group A|nr:NADH-dependent [FeFe] hydrogenase, group A6 [Vallitaleaceae bacterium]